MTSAAGGKKMLTPSAIIWMNQMRMNFGKKIMQSVKLLVIVPFTPFLNLESNGYTKGSEKITGRTGMNATSVYHSGRCMPLKP